MPDAVAAPCLSRIVSSQGDAAMKMQPLPEPYHSLFQAALWDCGAEAIPELVRKGADLSYCDPNTGGTALYVATISDRARSVEALLLHGADPKERFSYRSPVDGRVEAER